jgi:hypothetical protein
MLLDVYWNLIDAHGFDPDWLNNDSAYAKTLADKYTGFDGLEHPRPARDEKW